MGEKEEKEEKEDKKQVLFPAYETTEQRKEETGGQFCILVGTFAHEPFSNLKETEGEKASFLCPTLGTTQRPKTGIHGATQERRKRQEEAQQKVKRRATKWLDLRFKAAPEQGREKYPFMFMTCMFI